jgi:four helix bundle protein
MTTTYISGYRNLVVWQEAKNLAVLIYELTEAFPKSENFGLKSQIRRASVSVVSQIAEGWLRRSKKDKLRYLEIGEGSLLELESQGEIAYAVKYWNQIDYDKFTSQRTKVGYLLYRYKKQIED